MGVCILLFFAFGARLDAKTLADWSPESPLLAALFLIALYAVKSMTVFFPLVVLYLAAGLLFPLPAALLVNLLGLAVCCTAPWLVGRFSAADTLERLRRKYPKLETVERLRRENRLLFALLTRAVGVLPGDVVSLYLGASGTPYGTYLSAGLLGGLPRIACATVLGGALWQPGSGRFWLSLAAGGALTALCGALGCFSGSDAAAEASGAQNSSDGFTAISAAAALLPLLSAATSSMPPGIFTSRLREGFGPSAGAAFLAGAAFSEFAAPPCERKPFTTASNCSRCLAHTSSRSMYLSPSIRTSIAAGLSSPYSSRIASVSSGDMTSPQPGTSHTNAMPMSFHLL